MRHAIDNGKHSRFEHTHITHSAQWQRICCMYGREQQEERETQCQQSIQFIHYNFTRISFFIFFFAFCMVYVVAYFHVFLYHEGFSLSSPVYQYIYIYNRQNRLSNANCIHTNFGVLFIDKVPICRRKTHQCATKKSPKTTKNQYLYLL